MIEHLPPAVQKLVRELSRMPSIGEKSATRLAYFLITQGKDKAPDLAKAIVEAANSVTQCEKCFHLSDAKLCRICSNTSRDHSLICVVEKPTDVLALERSGDYRGIYHVLHGLWAPLRGQGPEDIRFKELLRRVETENIKEVIIATSSTVEGDATALFLARALTERGVSATRLAQGMPKGGELEYADDITLSRAISGRTSLAG